jgi:hypothetical protein
MNPMEVDTLAPVSVMEFDGASAPTNTAADVPENALCMPERIVPGEILAANPSSDSLGAIDPADVAAEAVPSALSIAEAMTPLAVTADMPTRLTVPICPAVMVPDDPAEVTPVIVGATTGDITLAVAVAIRPENPSERPPTIIPGDDVAGEPATDMEML